VWKHACALEFKLCVKDASKLLHSAARFSGHNCGGQAKIRHAGVMLWAMRTAGSFFPVIPIPQDR